MLYRLHLITGATDAVGNARISAGAPSYGLVNRHAFVFIALEARSQTAIWIVVGFIPEAFPEANSLRIPNVVGPNLSTGFGESNPHDAFHQFLKRFIEIDQSTLLYRLANV